MFSRCSLVPTWSGNKATVCWFLHGLECMYDTGFSLVLPVSVPSSSSYMNIDDIFVAAASDLSMIKSPSACLCNCVPVAELLLVSVP